jgi:hypothetical protein
MIDSFQAYVRAQTRRVLTQMDRDIDSPTFGCFDRNYWHYKIRDYPSSILQQGVFTLEAIRRGHIDGIAPPPLAEVWAVAAINALSRQTNARGGVDEYYPFEHSFPAAAFGLYAAARVLFDWATEAPHLLERVHWPGLQRLAFALTVRKEMQASNQQAAALAGLALASRIPRFETDPETVRCLADDFLATQHCEGWYEEYGGPDVGYLSVTLDALADYHDATGDVRALEACDRAIEFICRLVGCDGTLPQTLNSRNTDYVVPYGIIRRACLSPSASWLARCLFDRIGESHTHFLWPVDDRYHSHYIYASVVRSLPFLAKLSPAEAPASASYEWLAGCGYWIVRRPACTIYAGARKGGLVRVHRSSGEIELDHGWRIYRGASLWTTNWWTGEHAINAAPDHLHISGRATGVKFHVPSPWAHVGLRFAAFVFRERLIPMLKRVMIFRSGKNTGPTFTRSISISVDRVIILDEFSPQRGMFTVQSPRQNLRHVASADSFSLEEFLDNRNTEKHSLDQGLRRCREFSL